MQKFKKITALALAMVMVVGGSMTAFAEEPATEGSLTGTGSSEGTVDKHIIKVVLPTVASDSEMFNFTIDSERLLQETEHERLGDDVIFPESSSDTGVYFITDDGADKYTVANTATTYDEVDGASIEVGTTDVSSYYIINAEGEYELATGVAEADTTYYTQNVPSITGLYEVDSENAGQYKVTEDVSAQEGKTYYTKVTGTGKVTYANESAALKVESQSSAAVELTVEVQASAADTDFALVATAAEATGTTDTAKLYLALNVGDEEAMAVVAGDKITKTVTIAGDPANFETVYDDGYKFAPIANPTWETEEFTLSGAVSQASAKGLTSPTLTVTWSYADPAAVPDDVAPSIVETTAVAVADTAVEITMDLGKGDLAATGVTSITFVNPAGVTKTLVADTDYTVADGKITLTSTVVNNFLSAAAANASVVDRAFTITFDDEAGTTDTFTLTKE